MTVKTAISIREDLFAEVEQLAKELGVSRSQVFAMALEEFIVRRQNRQLLDALNRAYADEPTDEERALLQAMRRIQREVADEWKSGRAMCIGLTSANQAVRSRAVGIPAWWCRTTSSTKAASAQWWCAR